MTTKLPCISFFCDIQGVFEGKYLMALLNTNAGSFANNVNSAAEIFDEYGDFIRTVICYQVKNDAQVDDLFQDFFLALVSKPIPQDIQNMKSFLYKMIVNDIIDAIRRMKRYQSRIHKYADNLNRPINKNDPENVFIKTEEINKVFELIEKRLPKREAQAITLRYKNNYAIKEVAKKMDVDERSVSRYISVGFSKVRQFLAVKQGERSGHI